MPKKVWTAQDEEERKRRRAEVEAQRAQQVAQNQMRRFESEEKRQARAAELTSAARPSEDVVAKVQAENRAAQREVEKQTAGKDSPSQYKHAYETRQFDGNYGQFKNNKDAYRYAGMIQTDEQRDKFLRGWADYNGGTGYSIEELRDAANSAFNEPIYASARKAKKETAEKIQTGMSGLGDLYDADGGAIDKNTATFAQVVQGIRSIVDATKRGEAIKNLEALAKTEGSRFYGQTIDTDLLNTYLGNPDFTEADYKEKIKSYVNAFYPQKGYETQNAEKYQTLLRDIENGGYSENVQRQLLEKLNDEYTKSTGKQAPNLEELHAAMDAVTQEELGFGGKLKAAWEESLELPVDDLNPSNPTGEWMTEEKKAEGPAQEKLLELFQREVRENISAPMPNFEKTSPAARLMENSVLTAAVGGAGVPKKGEVQGPQQRKLPGLSELLAQGAPEKPVVQDELSVADAYAAYLRGDELSEGNYKKIEPYVGNEDIRAGLLMATDIGGIEYAREQATDDTGRALEYWEREDAERVEYVRYNRMGKDIAAAAFGLDSPDIPEDMATMGKLMLADVALAAQKMVESGDLVVPSGANMYAYALKQVPELAAQVAQVANIPKEVNRITTENTIKARQAEEQAINEALERSARGDATDADVELLATQPEIADIDVNADPLYHTFRHQLTKSMWYDDDGAFWMGDSLAAQEGKNLTETGAEIVRGDYKRELRDEALSVIDEYTRVALKHKMSLENYLGMNDLGLEDLMNVAYHRMVRRGAQVLADPNAPEEIEAVATAAKHVTPTGWGEAMLTGGARGVVSYAEDFMSAPYNMLDVATYEARREQLMYDYEAEYDEQAARMYRQHLLEYANSGNLSKESADALKANIRKAKNIFDVAFDTDQGLMSWYRDTMENLGKTVEALESNIAYMDPTAQKIAGVMSGLTYSGAGMVVSTLAGGGATALGMGSKAASYVGTTAGFGLSTWNASYNEGTRAGLNPTTAANRAFGNALLTVLTNAGGTESMTDLYFGSDLIRKGIEAAKNKSVGLLLNAGKTLWQRGLQEGAEEMVESGAEYVYGLFDGVWQDISNGKGWSLTSAWKHANSAFVSTDVPELAKEIGESGLMGFVCGELFSVVGVVADTIKAGKQFKLEQKFDSLRIAGEMTRGKLMPTDTNLAKFLLAVQKDVQSAEYNRLIDSSANAARDVQNMVTAALIGTGEESRNSALEESRKADSYERMAEAAHAAVEKAKNEYMAARDTAMNGNLPPAKKLEAAKALEGFRTAWAKAQTTLIENKDAAEKARQLAGKYMSQWLKECQMKGLLYSQEQLEDIAQQTLDMRNSVAEKIVADDEAKTAKAEEISPVSPETIVDREPTKAEEISPVSPETIVDREPTDAETLSPVNPETIVDREQPTPSAAMNPIAPETVVDRATPTPEAALNPISEEIRRYDEEIAAARAMLEGASEADAQYLTEEIAELEELKAEREALMSEPETAEAEAPAYTDEDAPPVEENIPQAAPAVPTYSARRAVRGRVIRKKARAVVQANREAAAAQANRADTVQTEAAPKKEAPVSRQGVVVGMEGNEIHVTKTEARATRNPIQTLKSLAKVLKIGQAFGTRNMEGQNRTGALGYFNTKGKYIATDVRHASNVEVGVHEVGHAVADLLGMTGTERMIGNLPASFEENYEPYELPHEAFAEFFWRYMISDTEGEAFAGEGFIATMERAMRAQGIYEDIQNAKQELRSFLWADAMEQSRLLRQDKNGATTITAETLADKVRERVTRLVDSTRPAEDVNSAVREAKGGAAPSEDENLRHAALMLATAAKRASYILTENLTSVDGTYVGESLRKRLEKAGLKAEHFEDLIDYMLLKHSLDRDKQNKAVFDRQSVSEDSTKKAIARIENDANYKDVVEAAKAFQAFRHDVMMEYMVKPGYMTEATLATFEKMYPNYVPTYRVKDAGGKSTGGKTYKIMGAKGSSEEIINPIDSFVDMVNSMVAMNLRNELYKTFDRIYNRYDGMGVFGRPVEESFDSWNTAEVQDKVLDVLAQADASDDVIRDVLETIGHTQYKRSGGTNVPNAIKIQMPDGKTKFYEIFDPLLFEMLEGTQDGGESGLSLLAGVTRTMSMLTTGSNPVFGIRNAIRDFQNSVNYGTWAKTYADGANKWLKALWEVWKGSGDVDDYLALGGGGWTRVDTRTKKGAEEYREGLVKGYHKTNKALTAKWLGKKVWSVVTMAKVNKVIEQASRFAEYKYGDHDLSTPEGRREAYLAAQDVSTDFSRRGNAAAAQTMRAFVPFFNASLQGIYRTGRQFTEAEADRAKERFMKTVINTGITSALASGLMLLWLDDEDKEEFFWLSDDLKAKHIYLPNFAPAVFGESPLIRLPLNQDPLAYAVHAAVTNAMWFGEGEEWAIELCAVADNMLQSVNPVGSTIMDPINAVFANKTWYGSSIVPRSMENVYATEQYTEETPDMFIALSAGLDAVSGGAASISPMMLQYLAEQYTGFVGQMVIPFMSKNKHTGKLQGVNAVIAKARNTLISDPLKSNDVVSCVYDNDTLLTKINSTSKKGKRMPMLRAGLTDVQKSRAIREAYDMTHSGGVIYEAKKAISAGYDKIDKIEARTDLTDEQKYLLVSAERRKMIELALDANEAMAEYREAYLTGESFLTRWLKN